MVMAIPPSTALPESGCAVKRGGSWVAL